MANEMKYMDENCEAIESTNKRIQFHKRNTKLGKESLREEIKK